MSDLEVPCDRCRKAKATHRIHDPKKPLGGSTLLCGECFYRGLLVNYIDIVGEREGVDYLYERDWTPEEWAAMNNLEDD